jgi:hypothetical protein
MHVMDAVLALSVALNLRYCLSAVELRLDREDAIAEVRIRYGED